MTINLLMTTNTKEWIQYMTATVMIVSGIVMSFISFFMNGDVADGVLWYMAQGLTYAGGIFGVSIYFKTKLGSTASEIKDLIERKMREIKTEIKEDEAIEEMQ